MRSVGASRQVGGMRCVLSLRVCACARLCVSRACVVVCVRVRVCRVRMRGGQGGDDGCTAGEGYGGTCSTCKIWFYW